MLGWKSIFNKEFFFEYSYDNDITMGEKKLPYYGVHQIEHYLYYLQPPLSYL
jgi:hypothetical protein